MAADDIVGFSVDCTEPVTDFRGLMVGVTTFPTNLSLAKGQWVTWDCDRLRGGVRTSRVAIAMNARYDSTDIGVFATNN